MISHHKKKQQKKKFLSRVGVSGCLFRSPLPGCYWTSLAWCSPATSAPPAAPWPPPSSCCCRCSRWWLPLLRQRSLVPRAPPACAPAVAVPPAAPRPRALAVSAADTSWAASSSGDETWASSCRRAWRVSGRTPLRHLPSTWNFWQGSPIVSAKWEGSKTDCVEGRKQKSSSCPPLVSPLRDEWSHHSKDTADSSEIFATTRKRSGLLNFRALLTQRSPGAWSRFPYPSLFA